MNATRLMLFASLHKHHPLDQLDGEIHYPGYARVPWGELADVDPHGDIAFPTAVGTTTVSMPYLAIGRAPSGPGEVVRVIYIAGLGGLPMALGVSPGCSPVIKLTSPHVSPTLAAWATEQLRHQISEGFDDWTTLGHDPEERAAAIEIMRAVGAELGIAEEVEPLAEHVGAARAHGRERR